LVNNAAIGPIAMRYPVRSALGWLMPNLVVLTMSAAEPRRPPRCS
jgi:hypothetical protein